MRDGGCVEVKFHEGYRRANENTDGLLTPENPIGYR